MEAAEVRVVGDGGGGAKPIRLEKAVSQKDRFRLRRQTLEAVLEQYRQTIELLSTTGVVDDDDDDDDEEDGDGVDDGGGESRSEEEVGESSAAALRDREADEFCDLLKSRIECPDFLEKLESAQASIPQSITEEGSSWDMVNENDLWEGGNIDVESEEYVLVRQEDIVDGVACFMAAYLLSLKETKDLTPKQIQEALGKTFSVKKKKGKLRKAWDGSKVIYNVASWGATAIGIYQNPALVSAATAAFWTSCRVISKFF